MRIALSLVCDRAHRDPDGRLHVEGQYLDLHAPGFPAKHDLTLVAVLQWDPGDHGRFSFSVELVAPDGRPNLRGEGYSEVGAAEGGPPPRTYYIEPLQDVVFPEAGEYRFRIRVKGAWHEGPVLYLWQTGEDPPPAPG